jgi:hypothetical protein
MSEPEPKRVYAVFLHWDNREEFLSCTVDKKDPESMASRGL